MIYFIQSGEAVKIGYAANPEARVSYLQCSTPNKVSILGLCQGLPGDERALHRRFAKDNIRREWFRLSSEISSFISQSCQPYKPRLDGRRQRHKGRTAQFNHQVRPDLKERFAAKCKVLSITHVVCLERMLEDWLEKPA